MGLHTAWTSGSHACWGSLQDAGHKGKGLPGRALPAAHLTPSPCSPRGSEGRGLSKLLALGLGTCPLLLPGLDQTQLRACRGQQGPRGLHTREGDPGDNPPLGAARQGPIDCVLWLGDRRLGQEGPQHSSPGLRLAEPPPPRPAPPHSPPSPRLMHFHVNLHGPRRFFCVYLMEPAQSFCENNLKSSEN